MTLLRIALAGVVTVGDGRGFVVEGGHQRYVITAAHCLPERPAGPIDPATLHLLGYRDAE
jgi:hypothetical protein